MSILLSFMMLHVYIVIVLLIIAGYYKGKMDAIAHSNLRQWDWEKKYDFTKDGNYNHWWYFGLYKPKFPERFPFSATMLVFVTDKWHRYQFIMLRAFYLAISIGITTNILFILLLSFVVFPIVLGSFFELSYTKSKQI